jgi:hypothetical protein
MQQQPTHAIVVPWCPRWQALRVTPTVFSFQRMRSAQASNAVIDQFDLESNYRYKPARGYTWCNIFAWDWSIAMSCEIPHWIKEGEISYPQSWGAQRSRASVMFDWLIASGPKHGWKQVAAPYAVELARKGQAVLAAARSDHGPGHMSVVLPESLHQGIVTAQAGGSNWRRGPLSFGELSPVFFWHE